jgi:uncharacterized membrane protein YccC
MPGMRAPILNILLHPPAHVVNGLTVALGIGLVQASVNALGGSTAALAAVTGAVCSSLADVPITPSRTWRRVLTAALIACLVSLIVHVLRPYPVTLGLTIALISFAATMMMVWGPRAGPTSFVGILAFIFSIAAPAPPPEAAALQHALMQSGWAAAGALLYFAWAVASSALLQPRYRTLALASALAAVAQLLRSRADLVSGVRTHSDGSPELQAWIETEAQLDERLQLARDLLFVKLDSEPARRQAALLLLAIDLRDTLLTSELDIDLLGDDDPGKKIRQVLAADLMACADAVTDMYAAVRFERALPSREDAHAPLQSLAAEALFGENDLRLQLFNVLVTRRRHIFYDLAQMQALMHGAPVQLPLADGELQLFVSPEGWPLGVLKRHTSLRSPVVRHALRMAIALTSAYFIGYSLPWAFGRSMLWSSHPAWLVLSVAVVLRGNLEQTLSRRNTRVAGTILGCLIVLSLSRLGAVWVTSATFLVAVGVAHSFVNQRYLVTSAAASVMALLQAHLLSPHEGFAVFERITDTFLGALLAWGFSYVLPSWEKNALERVVERVQTSLAQLATEVLHWPRDENSELQLRLARREVYDALGNVAALAQRTSVEPKRVRISLERLAALLRHSHALLAHLASVRVLLGRRLAELDRAEAEPPIVAACAVVQRLLKADARKSARPKATAADDGTASPTQLPAGGLMHWLRRRLRLAEQTAAEVTRVAGALQSGVKAGAKN